MPLQRILIPPRVVVDCHFFIDAITLTAGQRRKKERPDSYDLIRAFDTGCFLWTWVPEILDEYQQTAEWLIRSHRPGEPTIDKPTMHRVIREIRSRGFEASIPDELYETAWEAIMDPRRSEAERDEDDVIYAATAHAADAYLLLSRDRSLTSLGSTYQAIPIVRDLPICLQRLGFERSD